MSDKLPAIAEEYLLQLEENQAFKQIIVEPYKAYAAGALRRALAEARKPAGPMTEAKDEHGHDPAKFRNPQIVCDLLREYAIYNEVSTLVESQLADLRARRASQQKAAQPGQKHLPENDEPA